jgi:hypothetical protein
VFFRLRKKHHNGPEEQAMASQHVWRWNTHATARAPRKSVPCRTSPVPSCARLDDECHQVGDRATDVHAQGQWKVYIYIWFQKNKSYHSWGYNFFLDIIIIVQWFKDSKIDNVLATSQKGKSRNHKKHCKVAVISLVISVHWDTYS